MTLNIQPLNLPGVENKRPLIIAGPCSAESEEQVMTTARDLCGRGFKIFRAGVWKPRTKPGGFEGRGEEALPWLRRVHNELGMLTATEVATPEHVRLALEYGVDLLWVGARTTADPFAVQAVADALEGHDIPVLVKNPVNPDLELWIGALERIGRAGITRLGAIHRGFTTYDKTIYRNQPMWHIPIELSRRIPGLPIICDPSHIGGKRELVAPLCQQALDLGLSGMIIESHCNPAVALSDAAQQVTPEQLSYIVEHLTVRSETFSTEDIRDLRRQIDEIDDTIVEILSKRMRVCREIGQYKKEHNMTIVSTPRYSEILQQRSLQGEKCQMDGEFIKLVFGAIHKESVRQQMAIINRSDSE